MTQKKYLMILEYQDAKTSIKDPSDKPS
jgi:hypothetical protein